MGIAARHHVAVPGDVPSLLLGQHSAGFRLVTSLLMHLLLSLATDADTVAHISRCERCQ